jgi:multicomponent Na+:H+ antiporter subunit E
MAINLQKYPHYRKFILLFVLMAVWLLWSGLFKPTILALGLISCVITFILARRMGYLENRIFALRYSFRLFGYWGWLLREVIRSSLEVSRIVLDPRLPISPRVLNIKSTSKHPVDQVILANSITLTPGTLALDLHEGVIKVHTLTEAGARDLMSSEMDRRVARLHAD